MDTINRRDFIGKSLAAGSATLAALGAAGVTAQAAAQTATGASPKFKISLAAWSLNRTFGKEWKNIDLPRIAREKYGIEGVEFVNSFFELPRIDYLNDLKKQAADHGVTLVLIMCDGEGDMSSPDKAERMQAATNHRKWVDIAHYLGCHAIRCNAGAYGKVEKEKVDELVKCGSESFRALCEYARESGVEITIENHGGGYSSNPEKLIQLIKMVDHPLMGLLPDWGNFPEGVDKYEAVKAMMPYAKALSAKCQDFGPGDSHPAYDLKRMVQIALASGYHGFIGIEYEGQAPSDEGIMACKRVLSSQL
jgi:L-ribulose-5-phosphate 3-epimerase